MKNTKRKPKEIRQQEQENTETAKQKTEEKQADKQKIETFKSFSCEIDKDAFQKLIKEQTKYTTSAYSSNVLDSIHFELKDNILTMVSTDGNRLLETKINVYNPQGEGMGCYNGGYLGSLKFLKTKIPSFKALLDILRLEFEKDVLKITDVLNKIEYQCPGLEDNELPFPPYKHLFPDTSKEGEYTQIALNINFINELNRLCPNPRTGIVKLLVKNNCPLQPVVAECNSPDVETKVLIMPIQVRV